MRIQTSPDTCGQGLNCADVPDYHKLFRVAKKAKLYHLSQLIHDCQHGFRQGKSCVTNLLEALDYIGACLDNGGQVDLVYLHMSKAFDRINHKRLVRKLASSGIGGTLLQWFQSYFTDRRQRVAV